jgi:predicted TIM-barrel fold metal-dependent hydrolase
MTDIACDCHVHLWDAKSDDHIEPSFRNEAAAVSGRPDGLVVDVATFDETFRNVRKVVVFGGRALHTGLHVPNRSVRDFVRNSAIREKLIPFVALDPNEPGFMEEFEEATGDWKFRGVKLMPMYANFDPRDRRLDPLYAACEKKGLPILFHMGTTFCRDAPLSYAEPMLLEPVALRFRDLKIIAAHLGHPFENQTIVLIRKQPNIYADLSALYYRPWQLFNSLMLAQEYRVTSKLLFGTDYPFTRPDETVERLREIMRFRLGPGLPALDPDWMEAVFARDTAALLNLS